MRPSREIRRAASASRLRPNDPARQGDIHRADFKNRLSRQTGWRSARASSYRDVYEATILTDTLKDLIRLHWDRRAPSFDAESPSHGLRGEDQALAWRRLMLEVAGETPVDALDIGCGTGFLSILL